MQDIANTEHADKTAIEPLNPTDAAHLNRAALATGLAQAAFGAAYAPPAHANSASMTFAFWSISTSAG